MIDLRQKEQEILAGLKDFQLATVERVDSLFRSGYRRVLVADEVGLGKTQVAKGLITRMAMYYQEERKKERKRSLRSFTSAPTKASPART